jgi:hypothetical protein
MTKNALLQDLARRLNYNTALSDDISARLGAFLDETLQELISEPGIGAYISRHEPAITFASVASQAVYGLPETVSRIDGITDRTTRIALRMMSPEWYRMVTPDPTSWTGTPDAWVPLGFMAVAKQPSDASRVFVDSTSASDVQTAYLEGIRTGGYPFTTSVTLTGTTAIDINTAFTDWIEVTKFYLSAPAVGTVTLHEDANGGTELARIPIGGQHSRYQAIALHPTPASAITYYVDSERPLPRMIHGHDEPPLPERFHRVLTEGALWREYEKKDDNRSGAAYQRYQHAVSQMRYFMTCPPDFLPSRTRDVERSRLGSYYPADRI